MTRELFICSCENTEHQIVFSWFEDDDIHNVYTTIHLRKKSFWTRLAYGIKYIFGYQCKYGAFDEFIFNPNDARKLQKVVNFLKEENDDAYLQRVCDAKHEIEKQGKKIDADNVWLQNYLSNVICFVNQFKKDFGL